MQSVPAPSPPPAPPRSVFLGVDVGTGGARAGLFDDHSRLLGSASSPIQIWKDGDCIEQSSTDIWHAICAAVRSARSLADVAAEEVVGPVAVDSVGCPVSVSLTGDARRNIIVWMDHRAVNQAEWINSHGSPVQKYCGGSLSPEMQAPKRLWVKENLLESWSMVFRWMDLSDWLAYRATGDDTRSLCTTVCKWTYLGHAHMKLLNEKDSRNMEACGWDDGFWEEIGLGELVEGNHAKIGRSVAFPGYPLGSGLPPAAAKELGLLVGTPVGTSLIDGYVGSVGVMERVPEQETKADAYERKSVFELLNKTLESMAHELKIPFISARLKAYMFFLISMGIDRHASGLWRVIKKPGICSRTCRYYRQVSFPHSVRALYKQYRHSLSTGCSVILPRENESVLFGSAILGAVAAKKYPTLHEAMKALNAAWQVVRPSKDPRVKKYHDGKYQVFRSLYEHQLSYRSIMTQASVEMQASVEL